MVVQKHSGFEAIGPITLSGDGLVYIEFRPDLDFETIRGNVGIPTLVTRGVFRGFSLPLWVADNKEELFADICVPGRWDAASDIYLHLDCWLSQAEDTKKFNLQASWEHYTPGADVVPNTSANVELETDTGVAAAQFQSYKIEFQFPYDDLARDDVLQIRIRRIAASLNEIAGEIVVSHLGVIFRRNRLGVVTP